MDAPDALVAAVQQLVAGEAERLREEAIREAVAKYEADLREAVGRKAIRVAEYYSIEIDRENLLITVKHSPTPERLNG